MQNRHRPVVTGWQLFCLIVNTIVGTGVYTLARDVAEPAGAGGLLSMLLAGILMVVGLLGLHLLASRFPRQTLNEYIGEILGTFLGKGYLLVYALFTLLIGVSVPRAHFPVVSAWALGQTPQLVFMVPLVFVCWNVARRGVVVTARVVEMINYLTLTLIILLVIPVIPIDLDFVRPLFEKGVAGIAKGILPGLYAFAGFDVFLIVYPYVRTRRKFGIGVAALGLVTFFYLMTTLLIIGNLGIELILMTTWPLQSYLNRFALEIFERADVVFLIAWTFQIINTIVVMLYIAITCLQGAFPCLNASIVYFIVLILAIATTSYQTDYDFETRVRSTYSLIAIGFFWVTPWLLWMVSLLRGKKGESSSEEKSAA